VRLISFSPAVTEILFALGAGGHLVCCDQFSDYPEKAREVPHLRGHQKVDAEEITSFQPDLVFTSTLIQTKLAEELRAAGLHVIHQDPRSLAEGARRLYAWIFEALH